MLDEGQTITKCLAERLVSQAFYDSANRILYDMVCQIGAKDPPASVAKLVQELKGAGKLKAVGGVPYLMEVSGLVATTPEDS